MAAMAAQAEIAPPLPPGMPPGAWASPYSDDSGSTHSASVASRPLEFEVRGFTPAGQAIEFVRGAVNVETYFSL
jgi:hypothetical protein